MDPREKYSRDIRWPVIDIGLTEDGRALIALNEECILRVWDLTGKEPKERVAFDGLLLGQGGGMILPGTQRLLCEISPSKRQQLGMELWDLSGDQPRREGFISGCWLPAVVTPDGRTLAAKPFGVGAIQLWDIGGKEPKPLRLLPGEVTSRLSSPAFTADGNVLMYGVEKAFRQVPINDAGRKQLGLAKDSPYLDSPVGLAAHQFQVFPDGKTLAVEDDKAIRLWDMVKKQAKFPAPRAPWSSRCRSLHTGWQNSHHRRAGMDDPPLVASRRAAGKSVRCCATSTTPYGPSPFLRMANS